MYYVSAQGVDERMLNVHYIYANCDHSFPIHTDLEIQVPTVENLALSNVLHLRPGLGENVAMHVHQAFFCHKLQSHCPLSSCPN